MMMSQGQFILYVSRLGEVCILVPVANLGVSPKQFVSHSMSANIWEGQFYYSYISGELFISRFRDLLDIAPHRRFMSLGFWKMELSLFLKIYDGVLGLSEYWDFYTIKFDSVCLLHFRSTLFSIKWYQMLEKFRFSNVNSVPLLLWRFLHKFQFFMANLEQCMQHATSTPQWLELNLTKISLQSSSKKGIR